MHTIFVYGTLKKGYGNHRLLEIAGAEFVAQDEAPGIVYGPFPFAKPGDGWIKGEVYIVDDTTLARLDRLEGHPHSYTRTSVTLRSGRLADIYYYAREMWRSERCVDNEWLGAHE